MEKILYPWQRECLRRWLENGGRGVVNVATGGGKTLLALAAAEQLRKSAPNLKVYIVVPKTFLASQWARALYEELGVERKNVGIVSGKRKDAPDRDFMIYVVNSARYTIARHIVSDFRALRPVLLVADECHHYGTSENARIFDFMEFIPDSGLYYSLGLSATPYAANFKSVLVPALGREIYRFGFGDALDEGIINPFTVFNISLSFDPDERYEYDNYTDSLIIALRRLKERAPLLNGMSGGMFFAQLNSLATRKGEFGDMARAALILTYRRKDVIYRARERLACVKNLIELIKPSAKIILFTERIETTEKIFEQIKNRVKGGVGLYHSEMEENARTLALRRFEDGEIRILAGCKALDEGLNAPEADVGVVVSSTNSNRQRIQRLGRVLRKKSGVNSRLYYLHVENTVEETTLLHTLSVDSGEIPVIDMTYRKSEGFVNPRYDELAESVEIYARLNNWNAEKIREAKRNIDLGRVSCDWMLSEEECRKRLDRAETRAERNYFFVMLILIRARNEEIFWGRK